MIVKAKPLAKLCEHEGRALPDDYRSDCWNDVDESDFACNEKKRILLKLKPPGHENAIIDNFIPIIRKGEYKKADKYLEELQRKNDLRNKQDVKEEEKEVTGENRVPKNDF